MALKIAPLNTCTKKSGKRSCSIVVTAVAGVADSLKLRILLRIVDCQTQKAVTYYRDEEHFA
jgi:hypothetical protein